MTRTIRVRVPATTANLGSGFDCVGMAFDWYDDLTLEVLDEPGLEVVVTGEGESRVPLDERHLVISSLVDGLRAFGVAVPGMHLMCHNTIPQSLGLGSSAAAIVAVVPIRVIASGVSPVPTSALPSGAVAFANVWRPKKLSTVLIPPLPPPAAAASRATTEASPSPRRPR